MKIIVSIDNKNVSGGLPLRPQYTQPGVFRKKGNFGSFLPGFTGRIVSIGYKNNSID
jgi:hypothetical protein